MVKNGDLVEHCAEFNSRAGFGYLGYSTFGCYGFDEKDHNMSPWNAMSGWHQLVSRN